MPRKKVAPTQTAPEVSKEETFNEETPIETQNPALEEATAPIPVAEPKPAYQVERTAESGAIPAKVLPRIYSGVCEFCGPGLYNPSFSPMRLIEDYTIDPGTQIGRCEHYKGVKIRCSYCPVSADWSGNITSRIHAVYVSPWNPNQLIIHCNTMSCADKHWKRAMQGRQ